MGDHFDAGGVQALAELETSDGLLDSKCLYWGELSVAIGAMS